MSSQCSTPSILSSPIPSYPSSTNLAEILSPSDDETDFVAFTCIYFLEVLQLRGGRGEETFVNIKGENPPLKVYERRRIATFPRPNDFATGKNR